MICCQAHAAQGGEGSAWFDFNPQLTAVQDNSLSHLVQIISASCPILPQHHHHIAIRDCAGLVSLYRSKHELALSIIKLHLI